MFTLYSVLGLDQVHSQVASRHYTTDYWSVAVCALCYAMGIIIWTVQSYSKLYMYTSNWFKSQNTTELGLGQNTDGVFQSLMGSGIMEMTDLWVVS